MQATRSRFRGTARQAPTRDQIVGPLAYEGNGSAACLAVATSAAASCPMTPIGAMVAALFSRHTELGR